MIEYVLYQAQLLKKWTIKLIITVNEIAKFKGSSRVDGFTVLYRGGILPTYTTLAIGSSIRDEQTWDDGGYISCECVYNEWRSEDIEGSSDIQSFVC